MPHPALIARYVEDLLRTLDTDNDNDNDNDRISGALKLSAVVGPGVSWKFGSGGALSPNSCNWVPFEIAA